MVELILEINNFKNLNFNILNNILTIDLEINRLSDFLSKRLGSRLRFRELHSFCFAFESSS